MIENLFDNSVIQSIQKDQLFYEDIKRMIKSDKKIPEKYCSRIYHKISALKKSKIVKEDFQNKLGVKCKQDNSYCELSENQISKVVHLENISSHISQLGTKINFKLKEIKSKSNEVINFLNTIFTNHLETIQSLKYNLDEKEVEDVAKIAFEGCQQFNGAFFFLLVYFVKSREQIMGKYQHTQQQINSFESEMVTQIKKLLTQYPADKNVKKLTKEEQNNLNQAITGEQKSFSHKPKILSEIDKGNQLKKIIRNYAITAKENYYDFEKLIMNTCLDKCITFQKGLKLNPDDEDPKDQKVIRISEKMLFSSKNKQNQQSSQKENKKKEEIQQKQMKNLETINEFLEREKKNYQKKLNDVLSKKQSVTFNVLDMVRVKFYFHNIEDILSTITKIKDFVQKNNDKFKIISIQNRFKIKIADVTLKIVINDKIISELQLTLQKNKATYHFAHSVYELDRSIVFSKIKVVDDKFQQKRKQFKELVGRCLQLKNQGNHTVNPSLHETIRKYFEIENVQYSQLPKFLGKSLEGVWKEQQRNIELKECLVGDHQELMMVLFQLKQEDLQHQVKKDNQVGQLSNKIFKNVNVSDHLKAVLFQQIFKTIQFSTLYPRLKVFAHEYAHIQTEKKRDLGQKAQQTYKEENFMEQYVKKYFKINSETLKTISKVTARVFYLFTRINSFLQGKIYWDSSKQSFFFRSFTFGHVTLDVVSGEMCQENVEFLQQIAELLYHQNEYGMSQKIVQWFLFILKNYQYKQTKSLRLEMQLLEILLNIKQNHHQKAKKKLQQIQNQLKEKQNFRSASQCDLWLILCSFNINNSLEEYQIAYRKYQKFCKVHCIQLKTTECAQQEWLLAQSIKRTYADQTITKNVLSTHFSKALTQFSLFLPPQDFLKKMREIWGYYRIYEINEPHLHQNVNIMSACINIMNIEEIQWIRKYCLEKWPHLQTLTFGEYNNLGIGNQGCFFISHQNWGNNLKQLNLDYNNISAEGCQHLTNANLPNLKQLSLGNNLIDDDGCQKLSDNSWKSLEKLNLGNKFIGNLAQKNRISEKGCEHLQTTQWPNLTHLNLQKNIISDDGCKILGRMKQWTHLTYLNLKSNGIQEQCFKYLKKANWKQLTYLNLQDNGIDENGCKYLISCQWPQLTYLNLGYNEIGDEGCKFLKKCKWEKLEYLSLNSNNIKNRGCSYISSAEWPKLTHLILDQNSISAEGCQYLSEATWPNLIQLSLESLQRQIKEDGCLQLAKAQFPHLEKLSLWNNKISDQGCKHINEWANWPMLKQLNLSWNNITAEGVSHLVSKQWFDLTLLFLGKNDINDDGCKLLKNWKLPNLLHLNLSQNKISDQGCSYLIQMGCPNLSSLYLYQNPISENGCLFLSKAHWLHLKCLDLRRLRTNIQDHKAQIITMFRNKWGSDDFDLKV